MLLEVVSNGIATGYKFIISRLNSFLYIPIFLYSLIPFETTSVTTTMIMRILGAVVLLWLAFDKNIEFSKEYINYLLIFICIILISSVFSASFKIVATLVAMALGSIWGVVMMQVASRRYALTLSLVSLLYFSIAIVFLQLVMFFINGEIILFHEMIFPMSESRTEIHSAFVRLGGMFIEPGTYANWMYALFILLIFSTGHMHSLTGMVVGLSMMLTVSVWGIFVGMLLVAISIYAGNNLNILIKSLILLLMILIVNYLFFTDGVQAFLDNKLLFESDSGASKLLAYDEFDRIWSNIIFFGNGFDPGFCDGCMAPQDAGVFINMSVVFGIFFTCIFFLIISIAAYKTGGLLFLILVCPLMLSKLFFWEFVLWMIEFTSIARLVYGNKFYRYR